MDFFKPLLVLDPDGGFTFTFTSETAVRRFGSETAVA
jgi:hypothetical protein